MNSTVPFWSVATLVSESAEPEEFQVSLEDMISNTGQLVNGELSRYEAKGTPFAKGDILFGKLRPYLAKYWHADRAGTAGGDIHVYRPSVNVEPRFLNYVVGSSDFVKYADAVSKGTKMPRAEWIGLREFLVTDFDISAQRAIAAYLDHETGQIDAMVAKLVELVEKLEARRSNTARDLLLGFPMVALGIHCRIVNGSTPLRSRGDYWTETKGTPWLNSASVNNRVVTSATREVTELALVECHLPLVAPGDLLIGITGQGRTRGMVAQSGIVATISQHVAAVQPRSGWDRRFLTHALRAEYVRLRTESEDGGSTKGAITCEMLSRFRAPLPEMDEQLRIADLLDETMDEIEAMLVKITALRDLLIERRAALITDVVTGRKAVA